MSKKVTDPEVLLYPRLTRFYGIQPDALAQMPRLVVRLYAEQMGLLQAEEMLRAFTISAYPHMEESDQTSAWRKQRAVLDYEDDTKPPERREIQTDAVRALGIAVVKKKEAVA